nr:VP2 protein [Tellina virus 1]
ASKQFSMLATRKSPYIKSLLLPETGPASIPDDKIRRHVKRSESTTTNLTSTTGKGMLIVYNNHPKNLVGSHYTYASDGKLRFDRNLYTAQDLSKNFNYGRKVSQLVTIKSTQLPAGVYAMQGTMNGVCIDGAPSEVETALKYETILSASTNALDKVAGVLVNDGVGVLSLPTTFDNDYIRMGDPAPSSFTPGSAQLSKPTHNPGLNSIVTAGTTGLTSGTKTISTTKTIISTDVINVDSTEGLLLDLNIQLMRWGVPSGKTATVTVDVKTVDLAGAETDAEQREIKISGTNTGRDNVITLSGLMMGLSGKKPLVAPTAAVVIEVSAISSESMTLTHSGHINNYSLTSLCAGTPGTTNPITIIIYTDLTPGGIMTVTAVSNFELIPNAELRKNIPTDFGNSDPSEMDFIKRILGQRETLELRTIWDMGMYDARRDVLSEFAHLDDNSLAMA